MLAFSIETEYHGLSSKQKSGFTYLTPTGFAIIESIPNRLRKFKNPDNYNKNCDFPEPWAEELQEPETWKAFHEANPVWSCQIAALEQFWNKQKNFVLCSNEFLLNSFEDVLGLLEHVKKAKRELKKRFFHLPEQFVLRYAKYLQQHHTDLRNIQQQIVYAMFGRLKTAYIHSNLVLHKKQHVDDVLFHVTDRLSVLGVIDKPELQSITPRTGLNEDFYFKFYDAVKKYGHSEEEKYYADILHWSNNLGNKAFLLSFPKSLSIKAKKNEKHKVIKDAESGLILTKTGNNNQEHQTNIAVPRFLKKYLPPGRRSPAWFYWQEHKILAFWEKRQSFLYKLHHLYPETFNSNDPASLKQLQAYQDLISSEYRNLMKEELPLLAFSYKDMINKWSSCLNNLYQASIMQQKVLEANIKRCALPEKNKNISITNTPKQQNQQLFEPQLQQWEKKKEIYRSRPSSGFYSGYKSKEQYKVKQDKKSPESQSSKAEQSHILYTPAF